MGEVIEHHETEAAARAAADALTAAESQAERIGYEVHRGK